MDLRLLKIYKHNKYVDANYNDYYSDRSITTMDAKWCEIYPVYAMLFWHPNTRKGQQLISEYSIRIDLSFRIFSKKRSPFTFPKDWLLNSQVSSKGSRKKVWKLIIIRLNLIILTLSIYSLMRILAPIFIRFGACVHFPKMFFLNKRNGISLDKKSKILTALMKNWCLHLKMLKHLTWQKHFIYGN